jgi:hypothetical protein
MKKRKTRASDVGEKVRSREMKGQRPNRETETVDKIYMDLPPSLPSYDLPPPPQITNAYEHT